MSELFSALELEPEGESRAGYRLQRLELLNWGTFDGQVARLELGGDNTLLTGDIGSGKSTLVDAVTTLLLPSQRIAYNKAAGAETRERSLRSYVLGHYKSERNEASGTSRPIALRDHRSYSVVLGVFGNEGHDETVTLAQVFWMKQTSQGQPQRFYVTASHELSISGDFADFGSDLAALRRRLKDDGAQVEDTFPKYAQRARRLLGIDSEQAMELFHQTVSMKSVGNLNDFVRHHMLEPTDTQGRINGLVSHFEDLTRAHDAVRRAKDQLEALTPLLRHCDRHDELTQAIREATAERAALRYFFAEHRLELLAAEGNRLTEELDRARVAEEGFAVAWEEAVAEQDRLRLRREGLGGDRIGELERLITTESALRDQRRRTFDTHAAELRAAGLDAVSDVVSFGRRVAEIGDQLANADSERADWDNRFSELQVAKSALDEQAKEVNDELRSLRERPTNIPRSSLAIRAELCAALGLAEDAVPFAGELIAVRPEYDEWRGAAERVLHGFALSLLVPNEQYAAASAWINGRHLGAKVVYYRVAPRQFSRPAERPPGLLLVDVLELRPGPFETWLADQLERRAGLLCATSIEEFQRERRAVTVTGQVKGGDGRHEKDDRFRIDDPRRYVLGWSNQEKVDALLDQAGRLHARLQEVTDQLKRLAEERSREADRRGVLERLSVYREWQALDWESSVAALSRLEAEKRELESSSAELADVTQQLAEAEIRVGESDAARIESGKAVARFERDLDDVDTRTRRHRTTLDAAPDLDAARAAYPSLREQLGDLPTDESDCEAAQHQASAELNERIDRDRAAAERSAQAAVRMMGSFRRDFPESVAEMDDSILAAGEFRTLRDRLETDDLPKFEAEFKRQLNTNTINDLAAFAAWLRRSADEIHDRIDTINSSLSGIDYNEGRYIKLEATRTPNVEIKEFRDELRACTDDILGADNDQYSEERFLRVKRILGRFRGREGHTEADRQWSQRVTDVRNWFTFAASERWKETDEEWEHYTDSDGKSGGQKEKLAYTILAASLAYQFKLDWGVTRSRDFRFAVIDEAFGRGSDHSTRYALGLFRRLGLQLLIVTPLQKVHVIEPFVAGVGFVENRTGERSRLQNLTIEEYATRQALTQAGRPS